MVNEMQSEFLMFHQIVASHYFAIQTLKVKVRKILKYLMERQSEETQNGDASKEKNKRANVEEPKLKDT